MKISSTTPNLYTSKNTAQKSFNKQQAPIQFTGAPSGLMDAMESKMANWFVKLLETKPAKALIEKTNSKEKKFTDQLTSHLIVFGSTLLSGFYVLKTLNNKEMDEDKRKTLAINQGLVYLASTVMAYTFDGWIRNKTNPYITKFENVNKKMDPKKLKSLTSGMKLSRSIMTIDMVYRFIAPVIVTPIANSIGNRLKENKAAKLSQANNQNLNKVG